MTLMTAEQFLTKLGSSIPQMGVVSLSVHDEQPCPQFEITSSLRDTAFIKGYYCESGDSFIQVSCSGREEFTGNEKSAEKFLELIKRVVDVLSCNGCLEKRWITSRGEVKRSVIDLPLRKTAYRLGKAPHFWQVGLTLTTKRFLPFLPEARLNSGNR
jgi:hypothetical protein